MSFSIEFQVHLDPSLIFGIVDGVVTQPIIAQYRLDVNRHMEFVLLLAIAHLLVEEWELVEPVPMVNVDQGLALVLPMNAVPLRDTAVLPKV
jgi:hypothetical protein